MKGLAVTQRMKQAANHRRYGCSYIPTLAQGEWICNLCGTKVYCPYCTREYPVNASLVACSTHKDLDRR